MITVYLKSRGEQVGTIHVRETIPAAMICSEIAYEAGRQARLRDAICVAENEYGDRLAVGDPLTEAFFV